MRPVTAIIILRCLSVRLVRTNAIRSRILEDVTDGNFEYEAVTDVSFFLNLALDAADMRSTDEDQDAKVDIYYNGRHAFVDDDDGNQTNISFAGLSLGSAQVMSNDHLYNIYRHAFYQLGIDSESDEIGEFDGNPVDEYGNTIVIDLFELNATRSETEGALIINVWMAIAHELESINLACRTEGDNSVDEMNRALDRAAALWIGADQIRGDNLHGHLLYNLAENAGELFGQDSGETWVNSQLMSLINIIQNDIQSNKCAADGGYELMRSQVNQAVSYITIPLVQMLIHHIMQITNESGSDMVELYALALLPRVAACDPNTYGDMLTMMVFDDLLPADRHVVIQQLQSMYSCFSITCEDVGAYQGNVVRQCENSPVTPVPLAGYNPTWDVRSKSYIDRDILQIKIFLQFQAYGLAQDWYKFGANSDYSLFELATNKISPNPSEQFSLFDSYYQSESFSFADNIIDRVLTFSPPFDILSPEQCTELVVSILQSVVMHLSILSELNTAIVDCKKTPADGRLNLLKRWDGGAALYIGSIEGKEIGGALDGQLLFGAAKLFCNSFGTCEPDNTAVVNTEIIHALNFGSQAIESGECDQAITVFRNSIQPALYVPLIQGALFYAEKSELLPTGTGDSSLAGFYGFALSLLPQFNKVSPDDAEILSSSAARVLTESSNNDFPTLLNAFRDAVSYMAMDCKEIGSLEQRGGLCLEDNQFISQLTPSDQLNTQGLSQPVVTDTNSVQSPVDESASSQTASTSIVDLAWGRYTFTSREAKKDSEFAFDVRDMVSSSNALTSNSIYVDGRHVLAGLFEMADVTSLESFSTLASDVMDEDPIYNFFRYALYEESTFEGDGDEEIWSFGDMVVKLALNPDNGNNVKLAVEAAVIMNIWMMISHRLYSASDECERGEIPTRLIDSAVALWIGQDQEEGRFDSGWMMYSIAQKAEYVYGISEKEADINLQLMKDFNNAKLVGEFCDTNPDAFREFRVVVNGIIKKLTVPLIQSLLYHISEGNLEYTELYALAVIPQAVSCKTSTFVSLKRMLVDDFSTDLPMNDEFYGRFSELLECLDMQCEDLGSTAASNEQLKGIVSALCSKIRENDGRLDIVGYEMGDGASDLVNKQARIDLDIRQIDILMRTRSYKAAADIYKYGRNSMSSPRTLLSLQHLATADERSLVGPLFETFSTYFQSDHYADDIITSVFKHQGIYAKATREQSALIVVSTVQSMVSYMAVIWKGYSALNLCKVKQANVPNQASLAELDTAVALFVGSLEWSSTGYNTDGEGELLYSIAKEICAYFGTCGTSGGASINDKLLSALSDMRKELEIQECDAAEEILSGAISKMLLVPLIQSSVYYAATDKRTEEQNAQADLAAGMIITSAVLPIVMEANSSSANRIMEQIGSLDVELFPNGASAISYEFKNSLPTMGIDCADLGILQSERMSFCNGTVVSPYFDTPTNLGDGLYVTTTYVQDRADIALDIKSMEKALNNGHKDFAKMIYSEGENSDVFNQYGNVIGHRSLAGFSLNDTRDMRQDPLFNIYMNALQDDKAQFRGREARLYADTLVNEMFHITSRRLELGDSDKTLPAEAAIALNLWMYLVHKLFDILRTCKAKSIFESGGVHAIDEAVAYWIGDGQIAGDSERGHLLYALAEKMGENFGTDQTGQSRTNTNILRLFNQAKIELSLPNACMNDPNTFQRLRHNVNNLVSQMVIPLIQSLIHNLRIGDPDRVSVYAHAFIPLVSACSPSTFEYLRDKLIFSSYNVADVEEIISMIRSTFPCFGIKCEDVGTHLTEIDSSCEDPPALNPLAGYRPASDVKKYAQLDLDILELDILMKMGAYVAAEELYTYGKHTALGVYGADSVVSLAQLATEPSRSIVPELDSFVRYFDGNQNYADTIIRGAILGDGNGDQIYAPNERRLVAVKACEQFVMLMAALQAFNEAANECILNGDQNDVASVESWDRGAAFLVGHLEGTSIYGSNEGMLSFALSKAHCEAFGTCPDDETESESVIDRINLLLYSGRSALQSGICPELRKATSEILPLLLVPLIQGTLYHAFNIFTDEGVAQSHIDQVQAFMAASAMLPLIEDVDRHAADTIRSNFEVIGSPLRDGFPAVFTAFTNVYSKLGVECTQIGIFHGMDPCVILSGGVPSRAFPSWLVAGVILIVTAILVLVLVSRRLRRKCEKGNELFAPQKGELEEAGDLLAKYNSIHESRRFSRRCKQSDSRLEIFEDEAGEFIKPTQERNDV